MGRFSQGPERPYLYVSSRNPFIVIFGIGGQKPIKILPPSSQGVEKKVEKKVGRKSKNDPNAGVEPAMSGSTD